MPAFYYSSTAGSYTLTGAVTSSSTIIVINSVSGLPTSTPYKVVLEPGQPSEEIVKVTGVAGTSLTVVRGWDGTSASAHDAGSVVRHMVTAEDFTLSRAHEDATVAHGATGAVVGTTNAQTLTNKNLTSGTNAFPSSLATITGTQALTNKNLSDASNMFPSSLATLTGVQALTNKNLSDATNVFPGSLATVTGAQALTNKNLTDATNVFPTTLARSSGQAFTGNVTAPNLPAASGSVAGKRMHWTTTTATANASGQITLTHGLGWTPTAVIAQSMTAPGSIVCTATDVLSSTQVRFTFFFVSTGAIVPNGTSVTFCSLWLE